MFGVSSTASTTDASELNATEFAATVDPPQWAITEECGRELKPPFSLFYNFERRPDFVPNFVRRRRHELDQKNESQHTGWIKQPHRPCSAWPGQACGYKVEHSETNRQCDRARAALGAKFDLRWFDDAVVLGGNVPLTLLDTIVDGYVAGAKRSGHIA